MNWRARTRVSRALKTDAARALSRRRASLCSSRAEKTHDKRSDPHNKDRKKHLSASWSLRLFSACSFSSLRVSQILLILYIENHWINHFSTTVSNTTLSPQNYSSRSRRIFLLWVVFVEVKPKWLYWYTDLYKHTVIQSFDSARWTVHTSWAGQPKRGAGMMHLLSIWKTKSIHFSIRF